MTVAKLLENYTYNTYSDPLELWDEGVGEYVGSTNLRVKINGTYSEYNTTFKTIDGISDEWDEVKDLQVNQWSVQINKSADGGLTYSIAIITER